MFVCWNKWNYYLLYSNAMVIYYNEQSEGCWQSRYASCYMRDVNRLIRVNNLTYHFNLICK